MHINPPLILTLAIDPASTMFFNSLRQNHFPKSMNYIDAHLTLFHALPNNNAIVETVANLCNEHTSFTLFVKEVASIGKGVAYKIESNELLRLHKTLQTKWWTFLSPQDRQKLWPHITVQNKVSIEEARQLLEELRLKFIPYSIAATGLQLWKYLNGPWSLLHHFKFKDTLAT